MIPLVRRSPPVPSKVFDSYWRFAAERQAIFTKRLANISPPWTADPVLAMFRFTNVYRATDRVSQFLIRRVIYEGSAEPIELFFRTILFRIFNSPRTWELLTSALGTPEWRRYSRQRFDRVLTNALERGQTIYSAAYITPPATSVLRSPRKHRTHLALLEKMMKDDAPDRVYGSRSLAAVVEVLRSFDSIGAFLALQHAIDLNYGPHLSFSEMDFVTIGPGSRRGLQKCFTSPGDHSPEDVIRWVAERQDLEFEARGLHFERLRERPMQLIDCQNVFCEVDKYARVVHPEVLAANGRRRIKQKFRPAGQLEALFLPPKWDAATLAAHSVRSRS